MSQPRRSIVAYVRFFRTLITTVFVFTLAWVCAQGVFAPLVAQAKDAPFPEIRRSWQSTAPLAVRLAAQNALFKEQYEDDLRASPESETARGDYRDNDRLDDYSLEASKKQNATDRVYRARLEAISTEGFPSRIVCRTTFCCMCWTIASRITS